MQCVFWRHAYTADYTIYTLGCEERTIGVLRVFYVHTVLYTPIASPRYLPVQKSGAYMVTSHYLLNNSAIAFCLQHRRCIWSLLFPPIFYFRIHWFPSFNCSTCSRNLVLYCSLAYNVNVVLSCVANILKNM